MIAFAAHELALDAPLGDGHTRRTHLQAAWKATGRKPAELEGPELPAPLEHVWAWFLELDAARGGNGFAPNPLGFVELRAWAGLTGAKPTPFEVECLRALDGAFFAQWAKRPKHKGK